MTTHSYSCVYLKLLSGLLYLSMINYSDLHKQIRPTVTKMLEIFVFLLLVNTPAVVRQKEVQHEDKTGWLLHRLEGNDCW